MAVIHLGLQSPEGSSGLPRAIGEDNHRLPIWPCTRWGIPCHLCYQRCGGLLPHLFTLTPHSFFNNNKNECGAVFFLWPFPGITASRCYLPSCPLVFGLSSPASIDRSDCLTTLYYYLNITLFFVNFYFLTKLKFQII